MKSSVSVVTMKLSDLRPHPDAVRTCEPADQYRLRKQVEKFGLVQLPLYNSRTRTVLDGDKTIAVLRDLGWTEVPVVVVDLPAEWEDCVHLARNNHVGEWNWQRVSELLKAAAAAGLDVGLTGFHESDTGPLTAAEWTVPAIEPDNQVNGQIGLL